MTRTEARLAALEHTLHFRRLHSLSSVDYTVMREKFADWIERGDGELRSACLRAAITFSTNRSKADTLIAQAHNDFAWVNVPESVRPAPAKKTRVRRSRG